MLSKRVNVQSSALDLRKVERDYQNHHILGYASSVSPQLLSAHARCDSRAQTMPALMQDVGTSFKKSKNYFIYMVVVTYKTKGMTHQFNK